MPPGRRRPFSSFMPTCMPLCVSWAGPAGCFFPAVPRQRAAQAACNCAPLCVDIVLPQPSVLKTNFALPSPSDSPRLSCLPSAALLALESRHLASFFPPPKPSFPATQPQDHPALYATLRNNKPAHCLRATCPIDKIQNHHCHASPPYPWPPLAPRLHIHLCRLPPGATPAVLPAPGAAARLHSTPAQSRCPAPAHTAGAFVLLHAQFHDPNEPSL